jgi:UDP-N-acetylglucosamine:LPS N-acetylglucosamine transferase
MQMMRLRPAFAGLDTAYCTVVSDYRNDVPGSRFYVIPDANRFTAYRIPLLLRRIGAVIAAERPDIVLTTGAMPGLLALVIAKSFHGARTVWLDSVANVDVMSTSARLARRFADAHLTQWPYLASGGTQYWGRVL